MSEHECDDAISQLYVYLDGELDAAVVARVEAHLQRCSPCLEAFDFEAELRRVIAARCTQEMPGAVRLRIADLLDRLGDGDPADGDTASV